MRSLNTLVGAAAMALCASVSTAQVPFNRVIKGVAITPSAAAAGQWDVRVAWGATVESTSAPLNLSTEAVLRVNGVDRASVTTTAIVAGGSGVGCGPGLGCVGGCGNVSIDGGMAAALLCSHQGPCDATGCDCACEFPPILGLFPPQPLGPGDEIVVILRPAPGALPEPDPTPDERHIGAWDGEPLFWDRGVESVRLIPLGTPGAYDVKVMWGFGIRTAGAGARMGTDIVVRAGGVEVGVHAACDGWITAPPGVGCMACDGSGCGSVMCGSTATPMTCRLIQNNGGDAFCGCGQGGLCDVVPGVVVTTGDEIVVILRPAPGALPTLPGFEDDDERTARVPGCVGDLDGDGVVGAPDLALLLGDWAAPGGPADLNGDGSVGAPDLALLLGAWGPCP